MVLSVPSDYLPVVLMAAVAFGFVLIVIAVTHWMGPHRKTKIKSDVFECGIESKENARVPFSIKYFLVAILFVLFDVEIIFMYPWAINFKEMSQTLGIQMFIEMLIFLALLLLGYVYIIKKGALKWE